MKWALFVLNVNLCIEIVSKIDIQSNLSFHVPSDSFTTTNRNYECKHRTGWNDYIPISASKVENCQSCSHFPTRPTSVFLLSSVWGWSVTKIVSLRSLYNRYEKICIHDVNLSWYIFFLQHVTFLVMHDHLSERLISSTSTIVTKLISTTMMFCSVLMPCVLFVCCVLEYHT